MNTKDFENLQSLLMGHDFNWFHQSRVSHLMGDQNKAFYFVHTFFERNKINSAFFSHLQPLLGRFTIKELLRIKANLYPNPGEILEHDYHEDYTFPHHGIIFSINTNNGFTLLEGGEKIPSVANQMVSFDTSLPHASTTCSDEHVRVNLVVNYL